MNNLKISDLIFMSYFVGRTFFVWSWYCLFSFQCLSLVGYFHFMVFFTGKISEIQIKRFL